MDCPVLAALADLPATPLGVAFSGGLDSSVLLHALGQRCPDRLQALHVDHGLQPESAAWAAHCQARASAWGLRCQVLRVRVERRPAESLEAAARRARYRALAEALGAGSLLALAQHREDQAETVLLRLLRRAGPRGLAAMRRHSTSAEGLRLWRPLLDLPRAALADYAARHGIAGVVEDPMNLDPRFDRVLLRRKVMPVLAGRWPDATASLAASAALLAADDLGRETAVRQALARCRGLDPASLLLPALRATDPPLRRPVLERWLNDLGAPALPGALLQRLADGLPVNASRAYPHLAWGGWRIERHRDELHASRSRREDFVDCSWRGDTALDLPSGRLQLLGAPALPWTARVRPRRGGERLQLPGRAHQHALKDCLQTIGLPPWERRGLPLLFCPEGRLVAAGDLLYAAGFERWLAESGARLRWTALPAPVDRDRQAGLGARSPGC